MEGLKKGLGESIQSISSEAHLLSGLASDMGAGRSAFFGQGKQPVSITCSVTPRLKMSAAATSNSSSLKRSGLEYSLVPTQLNGPSYSREDDVH